jgi:LEA14-like dessication related protein
VEAPPAEPPPPVFEEPAVLPPEAPRYSLIFEQVRSESLGRVILQYRLRPENPQARKAEIRGWNLTLNGRPLPDEQKPVLETLPGGEGTLLLSMDLELPREEGDFDEYHSELTVTLAGPQGDLTADAAFPRIRAPEFSIASIAIVKAELVNTRFRVDLTIDNPNIFPVTLSSFDYELYGRGRFWARGREQDVLRVPAQGKAEARLHLEMNFIDMRRELLDEVIALGRVPYRFTGEALVDTGVPLLPRFKMDFDRSGASAVVE